MYNILMEYNWFRWWWKPNPVVLGSSGPHSSPKPVLQVSSSKISCYCSPTSPAPSSSPPFVDYTVYIVLLHLFLLPLLLILLVLLNCLYSPTPHLLILLRLLVSLLILLRLLVSLLILLRLLVSLQLLFLLLHHLLGLLYFSCSFLYIFSPFV